MSQKIENLIKPIAEDKPEYTGVWVGETDYMYV